MLPLPKSFFEISIKLEYLKKFLVSFEKITKDYAVILITVRYASHLALFFIPIKIIYR